MSEYLPHIKHARFKPMAPEDVKYIVIHCAATPLLPDLGAVAIDRWHRAKGWFCIGYHYVVKTSGKIECGRRLDQPGAHAKGFNDQSIGICLVGGTDDEGRAVCNYTDEQWSNLRVLITGLLIQFPNAKVLGHRDLPDVDKDCPCFDVEEWVNTWRY